MHTLRQVIQRLQLVSTSADASVYEVAEQMGQERVGAIVIMRGDELVGVFSERDLMTRVVVAGRDVHETTVSAVMTHDVVTAQIDESVDSCLEKMRVAGCRHLPVVHDGRPVAMLSMRDLLRDEIEEQSEELRSLRAYIQQGPPV